MRIEAEENSGAVYDSRLLRWVWTYVRPYRRLFWLSVVLMPLNSIFALAPALRRQAHDRHLPGGAPIDSAGLARRDHQAFARPRHDRDGRALRDPAAGRVRHLLWPVLSDHDGLAVQPLGLAAGAVSPCRAAADGVLRSHAGRPPGQPDDHRYRRHQRNVQRRIADPVRRSADARPASSRSCSRSVRAWRCGRSARFRRCC